MCVVDPGKSKIHAWGVFAAEDLEEDKFVTEYKGWSRVCKQTLLAAALDSCIPPVACTQAS